MKILIFLILNFIMIPFSSFAGNKFPFYLEVISDNENLKSIVITKTEEMVSDFSNLTLRKDKDGRVFVKLFIYVLKHKNSNIDKDTIILSATHVNKRRIVELTQEVFKKDNKSSDFTKTIAADLMSRDSGIVRHINVAATDDIDRISVPITRFLRDLSKNIRSYYESEFFDMFKYK